MKTRKRIFAYRSNTPKPILVKFSTEVTEPEKRPSIQTTIYVIDNENENSLLNYGVATACGIVKMSKQVKEIKIRKISAKTGTTSNWQILGAEGDTSHRPQRQTSGSIALEGTISSEKPALVSPT
jgi:hypothetical protein